MSVFQASMGEMERLLNVENVWEKEGLLNVDPTVRPTIQVDSNDK